MVDLTLRTKKFNNVFTLSVTNLLNERYEKPATYSQDGRQFRIDFTKLY